MITISERREHESAKSFVLRVLIDNIINTRLEPGEKLNEPELCEQLGVYFRSVIQRLSAIR